MRLLLLLSFLFIFYSFFFLLTPRPPTSTLFPYTTLFRSVYSEANACPTCGIGFPELSPQSFSFNSPLGMCVECNGLGEDRKSTRLNSSHLGISYAVFCLKKKKKTK